MDEITPTQWIVKCSERLQERWATVDQVQQEETAVTIWSNAKLRSMSPKEAAALWLSPVTTPLQ